MTQLSLFSCDKRWSRRREQWVTPADHFLPAGYAVDVVAEPLARDFVVREHYSGSFPAARLSVGLWGPGPALVGVAVFSVPMSESVLRRWAGADHEAARARGESWSDWTGRVVRLPIFRRVQHPGNPAYVFGLDRYTSARLADLHDGGQPYPRRSFSRLLPQPVQNTKALPRGVHSANIDARWRTFSTGDLVVVAALWNLPKRTLWKRRRIRQSFCLPPARTHRGRFSSVTFPSRFLPGTSGLRERPGTGAPGTCGSGATRAACSSVS